MSSKYYEGKDPSSNSFEFGEYSIKMQSVKEKMPGLFVRKL
jgi:hypothetical protein